MNSGGDRLRLVNGRFELLERLGGGGMGLVWRARDTALDREVALKEVRPPDLSGPPESSQEARQVRERVLREARALARLQHPNVVIIHHIVDDPEYFYPWLVMELVRGGSLADLLARGPLGPERAAGIGRGVLAALCAAHAAGIQHRDIKPGNVLLRSDGTPVLTDFGIAALQDATALTATGSLIGSPEFIAPERIRGQEGDPSSDLWSLGMTLYVAVEGHHPLRRSSTLATLAAVLDEPLPTPVHAGPLAPVLAAVLDRDPAARPGAQELERMLAAVEHPAPAQGFGPWSPAGWTPSAPEYTRDLGTRPPESAVGTPTPPPTYNDRAPTPPPTYNDRVPTPPPGVLPHGPLPHGPVPAAARGSRATVGVLSGVVVVLAGALVWALVPGAGHHTAAAGPSPSDSTGAVPFSASPAAGATAGPHTASPAAGPSGGLLTPAGMRTLVKAFGPYMTGGRIKDMTVYPEYARAEIPTKADPAVYDIYDYRDGTVTREDSGGTMDDDKPLQIGQYDWDTLPKLFSTAARTLNVAHPQNVYLIVEPDLFDGSPRMLVYRTDSYGTGYLESDPKGHVVRTYKRD